MAKKQKVLKEATREDEKELVSVVENDADIVELRGRNVKVRWLHPAVGDWVTKLVSRDGDDAKILCKAAALIRLNGFWKCHLLYWMVWRWYYYVRQYTAEEMTPLFEVAQKKTVHQEAPAYLNAMILLTALTTARKQMTKEEAGRTLQELRTDNDGKSRRSMV